jgi:putative peptide zinc metalloprotease protein
MLMELLLAALALYVWLAVEPGLVRSMAFSVMVVGGVSTLLFNGNPLLRYDGYFVLCDAIETPNLAQRANQFWLWGLRHHLFGLRQAQPPHATPGERRWFFAYAPLALGYRVMITTGIALFLGKEYLYVGLAVGLWGLAMLLVWPALKGLRYVLWSAELGGRRLRPMALTGATLALLALVLLGLPAPLTTYAQGLVWPEENAQLRAAEAGLVSAVVVHTGDRVLAGQVALQLRNDRLETERETAQARDDRQRRSFLSLLAGAGTDPDRGHGRVASAVQRQEWQRASDDLDHAQATLTRLTVTARRDGRIELPRDQDLPGRWLRKGELFGHIVTDDAPTVRVVVSQDDIDLVRARLLRVEVRLSGDLGQVWPAHVLREVPAGDDSLPSMALALEGGGLIAVDGRDTNRPRALNRIFQLDLALPAEARAAQIGERAHVRFVHLAEPLALQWTRRLRQLLLSQLAL